MIFCEPIEVFDGGLAALLANFIVELLEYSIGSVSKVVLNSLAGRASEGIAEGGKEGEER